MEVLIKRFLKYNKSLVAVIGVSLLVVLFLLVIAVIKYLDMVEANSEVNKMRDTIVSLQDPYKNKVAVIPGNLDLLKKDYEIYHSKNMKIKPFFGHPYAQAVEAAARAMGLKNGDELIRKFYDFLAENPRERMSDRYKRFKMQNGVRWNTAINAFAKEAEKISFEKITDANVDDIFLQAIGLPREMSGRSFEYCSEILKAIEIQLNKLVLSKNIDVNQNAAGFSLNSLGLSTPTQIADSMQNMEIVGDMIQRIVKNAPEDRNFRYMKVLDTVSLTGKASYSEDRKIQVFRYKLKFAVTMDALRDIIKNLNESIKANRVYVLRNLKIQTPQGSDQAAVVVGLEEAPVLRDKDGKVIEIKFKDDSHLPYNQRRDYGKVLIGSNPFFNVEMDLDYMILKQYEYQQR